MPGSNQPRTRPQATLSAPVRLWTTLAVAVILLLGAAPRPSFALFDPGNVGLPPSHPGIDPGNPPPPPPAPLPLVLVDTGLDYIDILVRPPLGKTSQLLKQAPDGTFVAFQTLTPGLETQIRDTNLGLGREYCYRMTIFGGGASPDQSYTNCATTDWRVGFEGPGISADESAQVLKMFDWRDTQPLAQGSTDQPALYHMNILIEGSDPLAEQGLRTMGMHVQSEPIFEQELDGWNDSQAIAQDCTTDFSQLPIGKAAAFTGGAPGIRPVSHCVPIGRWVFAAVPGSIYNEIRTRMLDQINHGEEPGIRALVFRRVPVPEALAPGVTRHVLNYQYLGQQGFEFNAIQRCSTLPDGTHVCTTEQAILGWLVRKIVNWVVELADDVVEGVRSAIGAIERLIKGELRLDLNFRLLNTDPAFGTDQLMRSGWSGQPLYLSGVTVEVRQGLAAFYADTDAQGYVTLEVAKNADTKVCIQVENDTALLTEFVLRKTICVASLGKLTDYTRQTIDVRHPYLNTLAGMSDARDYLQRTAGISMPKITVLVGSEANELAAAGRSFSPCMGRVPSAIGLGADILGALGSLVNPAFLATAITAEFLYSVDIVLRTDDDDSRGVPVHEYGHTVMCEMLLRQGIDAFEMAWTDAILSTSSQSADSQGSYINEAWADFMTEQVVGGTNYFSPSSAVDSLNVHYCRAGAACFDENFHGTATFQDQVARIVSILHDAFDGNPQGLGLNDGSDWTQTAANAPLTYVGVKDSDIRDENVTLPGTDLSTLFERWDDRGQLLREDNFLGGLADVMKGEGVADSDVCALFALHDPSASCPGFVARRSWLGWLDNAPGASGMLDAFAAAPAPEPVAGAAPERSAALIAAIADLDAPPATKPAPKDAPCPDCTRPVVFDGTQKIRVQGLGKAAQQTAFAFRMGQGSFKGIDPIGHVFQGTWSALDPEGAKLRLRPDAKSTASLANVVAESAKDLGLDRASVTGMRAKVTLRLTKSGVLAGKIVLRFKVGVDGSTARGTYIANLRGA